MVLVAVASCLNSAIYTASRMLFSLAKRGEAPGFLKNTTAAKVPRQAVIASTIIGCVTTIINYFAPEKLFSFLLATSGAVALLVYLVIAVSQLRMRKKLLSHGRTLGFKMWLYPGLTWAVIVFIVGALGVMLTLPAHQSEVLATAGLALAIVATGFAVKRHDTRVAWTPEVRT